MEGSRARGPSWVAQLCPSPSPAAPLFPRVPSPSPFPPGFSRVCGTGASRGGVSAGDGDPGGPPPPTASTPRAPGLGASARRVRVASWNEINHHPEEEYKPSPNPTGTAPEPEAEGSSEPLASPTQCPQSPFSKGDAGAVTAPGGSRPRLCLSRSRNIFCGADPPPPPGSRQRGDRLTTGPKIRANTELGVFLGVLKAEERLGTINLGQKRLFQFWGDAFKFPPGKASWFEISIILNKCPDLEKLFFNFFFFSRHPMVPAAFTSSLTRLRSPSFRPTRTEIGCSADALESTHLTANVHQKADKTP